MNNISESAYFKMQDRIERLERDKLTLLGVLEKDAEERIFLAARLAEADKLIDEAASDRAMTFTPWRVKVRAYHKKYAARATDSAEAVREVQRIGQEIQPDGYASSAEVEPDEPNMDWRGAFDDDEQPDSASGVQK
jgi:hypothetical protein